MPTSESLSGSAVAGERPDFRRFPIDLSEMSGCVWPNGCMLGLRFAKSQPKRIGRIRVFVKNVKTMISSDLVAHFGVKFGVSVALRAL